MNAKRTVFAIVIVAICAVLCSCSCGGTATMNRTTPDETATVYTVTGSCELTQEGDSLVVNCKTDMMDGTLIKLSVDSYNGDVLASEVKTVENGAASAAFAVDQKWSGTVYGNAVVLPSANGEQTKEFYEKYGKKMQNINSEALIWNVEGNIIIFQSKELDLGA